MIDEDTRSALSNNENINCELDLIMYITSGSNEKRFLGVSVGQRRNVAINLECHDKTFFGRKQTSSGARVYAEDKSKKIAIFYNVLLQSFK